MEKNPDIRKYLSYLPDDDVLSQCMHCGMCLATCPTYELTKMERSSPRGRIRLIKNLAEGKLPVTETFIEEMNFCLDCQACETACPAGVKYGAMVEGAREAISRENLDKFLPRTVKRVGLNTVIGNPSVLKTTAALIKFYQKSGIQDIMHNSGFLKFISPRLAEMDKLAPKMSDKPGRKIIPDITKPPGKSRYKVLFPLGCIMDLAFADINIDTLKVLLKHDCEVISPYNQVCCGSLHAHNGEKEKGHELARKTMEIFNEFEFDYVISNSAGCGAFMKEYGHIFENDPVLGEIAGRFSAKVKDITEFLSIVGLNTEGMYLDKTVTYHDACHLAHTQKVVNEPRNIIAQIPGIKIVPLNEASWCCGSAGIYNVARYDDAEKFLDRKMRNIKESGAEYVIAANPGCLGQINHGIEKWDLNVKAIHTVTLLRMAYEKQ